MSQRAETFMLRGGLDMTTPAVAIDPGRAASAVNYFATERGYQRGSEFERYDGQAAPSAASFLYLPFKERTAMDAIAIGDTVTGVTSGAVGVVLAVTDDPFTSFLADEDDVLTDSVEYDTDDTALIEPTTGHLILVDVSGTFTAAEELQISAVTAAETAGAPATDFGPTLALELSYYADAQDYYRDIILAVPGVGPVRGVCLYDGNLYAFRNAEDGTACKMFKDGPGGWVEQDLGVIIEFTDGTEEYEVGAILSGGFVTATIDRVELTAGAWGDGDATGYLLISNASDQFAAGPGETVGVGHGSATLSGPQAPNVIPPAHGGNQFSFSVHNFGAGERMYVAYGAGRAFEWDGSAFAPIVTPVPAGDDKPILVRVFRNHLFLFFRSGAMLNSEIGNPLGWTTTGGAGEIALGSYPRDALEAATTAMLIICRSKVLYLTGNDAADFVLEELSSEAGGWARTAQNIGKPVYMDQRGLRGIDAVDTFSGFRMGTMSNAIAPIFETMEKSGQRPWCSIVSAAKGRYIAFCNDVSDDGEGWVDSPAISQTVIAGYMGNRDPEFTVLDLPVAAWCACSSATDDDASGTAERLFFGGADGMVYQLDKGTSQDGAEIPAFIRLPFNMLKTPYLNKRFHSIDIELDAAGLAEFALSADFNYGSGERPVGPEISGSVVGDGGYWGEMNWGEFNWSAPSSGVLRKRIDGVGQSCSVVIASRSRSEPAHTLTSMRVNWSPRGFRR